MLGSLVSRRRQNRSTFHEPGSAGIPVGGLPVCVSPARTPAFPGTDGFKVPMHGTKVVGAFHEPYEFRKRAPIESGVGPPHSTTLARWPRPPELPSGFGVRRPCGALDFLGRFTRERFGWVRGPEEWEMIAVTLLHDKRTVPCRSLRPRPHSAMEVSASNVPKSTR